VSGFGSTAQKFKVSTSTVLPGEHGSKPSSTSSSLLRFKLRHESIEAREILTSSLSPSSSSSSLSSSSSTPIHQDPADRMATVPPHIFTTKPSTVSDSGHVDLENTSLSNAPSLIDQGPSSTKTPKIVIRLGGGVNPGVLSCTQSPFVRTSEKPVVASPALVDTPPAPLAPPPLRLTISKDRLTYRGNDAAQNDDDSNASSSSSISESLNSSGDEDEDIMVKADKPKISNLQTSLPPPPLERLPDRTLMGTRPSLDASSATRISTRQLSEPLYKSATPARDSDKTLESRRNDVPPLLPLFSPVVTSTAPFQLEPPSLTTISSAPSHMVDRPHEGSSASLQRKRRNPPAKQESLSKRGRLNSSIPSLGSRGHELSGSTRVRVDSVFTDDEESDGNGAVGSAVKRPLSIDTNLPEANSRGSGSVPKLTTPKSQKFLPSPVSTRNVPLDTKRIKGRPRTKHTSAQLMVPSYSPVIKSKSQFAPTRCKSRSRMKPTSANASTCSSPLTKPGLVSSQRPASQVVVASAGNSYYFNNSGEQIWLCPICLLEDDGNLMIGCDSCDDWYHTTCLGLSAEPEVPQWFCPKCVGSSTPCPTVYSGSITTPVSSFPVQTTPHVSSVGQGRKSKGSSKGSMKHKR
ncbi:PHD-finger, partial [Opisthorchis viverrini]